MKKNISDKNLELCCACSSCIALCPANAISYSEDSLGFLYPSVDERKCINCGLCFNVCQIKDNKDKDLYSPIDIYAIRNNNSKELETSRSGGAFIAFSDIILEKKGEVYGAAWDNPYSVSHKKAKDKKERDGFKNSKYIQSFLSKEVIREINSSLRESKSLVLFSGTPCQILGLKRFLRCKNTPIDNLIVVDVVCQGVGSPRVWRKYVEYYESKYRTRALISNLRDKSKGWNTHYESIEFEGRRKMYARAFTNMYYENLMLRECCYFCEFCRKDRVGDITLADFWGWENVVPDFNLDNKGCSLVFINTEKGINLFSESKSKITAISCSSDDITQDNLVQATPKSERRSEFIIDLNSHKFSYLLKKYGDCGFKKRVKELIVRILK